MPTPTFLLIMQDGTEFKTHTLLCTKDNFGVPCVSMVTCNSRCFDVNAKEVKSIKVLPPETEHW